MRRDKNCPFCEIISGATPVDANAIKTPGYMDLISLIMKRLGLNPEEEQA
ncbi:hypothetical protein [Flaviflexus ciconiae]|nr:hypothetical protein [Flaviflexus ciconiae]